MTTSPTPQFEIPNEMRALAERNVEQAKLAFNNFMQAAQEAVSNLEKRVEASQGSALDISKKAMSFAERNILSAFDRSCQGHPGNGPNAKPVRSIADASLDRTGKGLGRDR